VAVSSLPAVSRRRLPARGAAQLGGAALAVPSRLLASVGAAASTWTLVAAMLAVWCVEAAVTGQVHAGRPIGLLSLGALPNVTVAGRGGSSDWWRYISSALLHQNPLQLAGNAIGVLVVGTMVERLYGRLVTLATFTLAAVAAGGLWVTASNAGVVPLGTYTVGASAGLCGLIGLLVMFGRSPHARDDPRLAATARVRALAATGLLLMGGSALPSVNNLAHAAGLCCGLLLGGPLPALPDHGGRPLRSAERVLLALVVTTALLALAVAGQQLAGRLGQPGW
jgi:membrane associated rhomboid family serine protease